MSNNVYFCTDNQILTKIEPKIEFSWESKYIGRKIIPEKYDGFFDQNGYYIETEHYLNFGIIANVKPEVDENGFITKIESFKAEDHSWGHGRPRTEYVDLNRNDIDHFSKVLDSVTIDPAIETYDQLVASLKKGDVLPGGFTVARANAQGVSLNSPNGEVKRLGKAKLLQAITILQHYIDVLYCAETMRTAPQYFDENEIPLYLAVFSKVDRTSYHNYQALQDAADHRELLRKATTGYPELVKAVETNDHKAVAELIQFAPLVIKNSDLYPRTPVFLAVQQNNTEVTRMLLEGGAYSKEEYKDTEDVIVSPLRIAVEKNNYEMIELLCRYHGAEVNQPYGKKSFLTDVFELIGEKKDLKAIKIILPYAVKSTYKIDFDPAVFSKLSSAAIDFLISIDGASIKWPALIVKKIYKTDKEKCCRMLDQGCDLDVLDLFINANDHEMFEHAISRHSNVYPRPSYKKIYERGGEWYQTAYKAASSNYSRNKLTGDLEKYLGSLIRRRKYDAFKNAIARLDINIPAGALEEGFCNSKRKDGTTKELQEFLEYVFENWDYKENQDVRSSSYDDTGFMCFSMAVIRYGSSGLTHKLLEKYPVRNIQRDDSFDGLFKIAVEQRQDDLYMIFLEKRLAYNATRPYGSGKNSTREMITSAISRCGSLEKDLKRKNHREGLGALYSRWIDVLRAFLSFLSIEEIDELIAKAGYQKSLHSTAYDYAVSRGIENAEILNLLKHVE